MQNEALYKPFNKKILYRQFTSCIQAGAILENNYISVNTNFILFKLLFKTLNYIMLILFLIILLIIILF